MADNSTLPATGDVIASDDISGVKYQRIKLIHGQDGSNDGDVSNNNPLPVKQQSASSATVTSISASLSAFQVITANTNRKSLIIHNESTGFLYLLFGTGTPSNSNFSLKIKSNGSVILNQGDFSGEIQGICSTNVGSIKITELT